MYFQADL